MLLSSALSKVTTSHLAITFVICQVVLVLPATMAPAAPKFDEGEMTASSGLLTSSISSVNGMKRMGRYFCCAKIPLSGLNDPVLVPPTPGFETAVGGEAQSQRESKPWMSSLLRYSLETN